MMPHRLKPIALPLTVALLGLIAATAPAQSTDDASQPPAWRPPQAEAVRATAMAWLDEQADAPDAPAAAAKLWAALPDEPGEAELLECLAGTFALAEADAAALVELCSRPKSQPALPDLPWLTDEKTPPLLADNMRLLYGRWLAQASLFDESHEQISALTPDRVVAPAMLLFYQSVVHHSLLQKESGLAAIEQLLDGAEQSPRRYVAVARLMQQDLEKLEEDSLDHIVRRMGDVRRRLDLGRAGKRVRKIEDGVIESLDKLIKKIEEEQKKKNCAGSSGNMQPRNPAPDSTPMGGKGPGEVTKRNIGSDSDWGDLPPKEREETLQQIGRDFPSHYRDVIEQYFRSLAAEDER